MGAKPCGRAGRGSRDSPMRCPTGELNGFPRRKSIVAAAAATNPWNQLTATASAADPSRDTPDGPRGGAGGGGAEGVWRLPAGPAPNREGRCPEAEGGDLTSAYSASADVTHDVAR